MSASTIWKFALPMGDSVTIAMPAGARVLHVGTQGGGAAWHDDEPCVWAAVDPARPSVHRRFEVRGTGHSLGDVGEHVGTFMLRDGDLVFHVFEAAT